MLSKFYSDYNGHQIPSDTHFPNVLESRFGIPRDRVDEAISLIRENARFARILDESDPGAPRILLDPSAAPTSSSPPEVSTPDEVESETRPAADWQKVCFYITPIGEDLSEQRKHADMMQKHLLDPVAETFGLRVIRADKIGRSGIITQQVFEHLARARLCVADLSFNNANAFYELGVRHVCKLPAIQVIRKGDRIPFDVSQGRTIVVDTTDVYTIMDRFESARRELTEQMKQIVNSSGNTDEDNPIHIYLPALKVTLPA